MTLQLYGAFVLATAVLMAIPGPNVALIVANSVAHGVRYGLLTVAGTSSAMVLQLILTGFGMAEMLGRFGVWMEYLRWIGVAYLVYLGLRQWLARPADLTSTRAQPRGFGAIYGRGFFVSLTNPKTLFFYGAFFPQFLDKTSGTGQILLLAVTFLALAILIDSTWATLAGRAGALLTRHAKARQRISGSLLMGVGLGLALARRR